MLNVLYYGPITPPGQPSFGGYAAANRKNCDILQKKGIEVHEIPKRNNFALLLQPFRLLFSSLPKETVIHIATPLAHIFMVPVIMLEIVARIKNIPVVLDIRAGVFISRYKKYNAIMRILTKTMLKHATQVTVEGQEYIEQLKKIVGYTKEAHYFPNVVACSSLCYHERENSPLNIFYFGRITESKGISIMLDTIIHLPENYRLFLAGPLGNDVSLDLLKHERITYLGTLNQHQLRSEMERMHFFLFPTHHIGEGQSNSLIEAMSQGLIPVTADNGFCREVVGNYGKVIPFDATAEAYIKAIEDINAEDITELGRKCIEHIKAHHNADKEIEKIIKLYKSLLI